MPGGVSGGIHQEHEHRQHTDDPECSKHDQKDAVRHGPAQELVLLPQAVVSRHIFAHIARKGVTLDAELVITDVGGNAALCFLHDLITEAGGVLAAILLVDIVPEFLIAFDDDALADGAAIRLHVKQGALLAAIAACGKIGLSVFQRLTDAAGKDERALRIVYGKIEIGVFGGEAAEIRLLPLRIVGIRRLRMAAVEPVIAQRVAHGRVKRRAYVCKERVDLRCAAVVINAGRSQHGARSPGGKRAECKHDQQKTGHQLCPQPVL